MAKTSQRCAQCGTRIPLHRRSCPVCVAKRPERRASTETPDAAADDAPLDPRSILADVQVPENFSTPRSRLRLRSMHVRNALVLAFVGVFAVLLKEQLKRRDEIHWLPLVLPCALLGLIAWQVIRLTRAPTLKLPAIVAQKRQREKAALSDDDQTRYFATLWFADGSTREYETSSSIYASLARASVGIAFVRLDQMLDFAVTGSVPLSKVRQRFPYVREARRPWWIVW